MAVINNTSVFRSLTRGWFALIAACMAISMALLSIILGLAEFTLPVTSRGQNDYRYLLWGLIGLATLCGIIAIWLRRPVISIDWVNEKLIVKEGRTKYMNVQFTDITGVQLYNYPCSYLCIECVLGKRKYDITVYISMFPYSGRGRQMLQRFRNVRSS